MIKIEISVQQIIAVSYLYLLYNNENLVGIPLFSENKFQINVSCIYFVKSKMSRIGLNENNALNIMLYIYTVVPAWTKLSSIFIYKLYIYTISLLILFNEYIFCDDLRFKMYKTSNFHI